MDQKKRVEIPSLEELKLLPPRALKELAAELRARILEVVAVNGGHLASNLGAVELTIALHRAFSSPDDKLIWDVSHQTYAHKLLTGRADRFDQLGKIGGICGFSNPHESQHDHFHAGHAGTALPLALGVAKNRDLTKRSEYVIPIIGDATLTCGMTFEAFNNISRNLKRFIVVLNDNAMSISKNVGAVTHILSRLLSNPTTNKLHQELDTLVSKIPAIGRLLSKQGQKLSESLKNLVSPAPFFEHYGLSYIGPIDGHDIQKLIDTFEGVKGSNWPVLIHVLTQKGKGMDVACENPVTYHGAPPFDLETGKILPSKSPSPTFPKIFGRHLLNMAERDPSLVAVTPAMSCGSRLDPFMERFPDRCIDVGIAESHSVTFSGGIAYGGKMKVVATIYATFLQRAFDNLFHDVAIQELPVLFALDRAGIASYGFTHHGIYDISFLNAMPNMIISQPRDGKLLKELLESAFSWKQPAAIRYPNLPTEEPAGPLKGRRPGEGEILAEGEELLILGLGHMNSTALEVRTLLQEKGITATVVDPVFVKPLDSELLCRLLMNHRYLVTIEEHSVICGLGAILNHFLMTQGFSNIQVLNFGVPETFLNQGSYRDLMKKIGLTAPQIAEKIASHFSLSKRPFSQFAVR